MIGASRVTIIRAARRATMAGAKVAGNTGMSVLLLRRSARAERLQTVIRADGSAEGQFRQNLTTGRLRVLTSRVSRHLTGRRKEGLRKALRRKGFLQEKGHQKVLRHSKHRLNSSQLQRHLQNQCQHLRQPLRPHQSLRQLLLPHQRPRVTRVLYKPQRRTIHKQV